MDAALVPTPPGAEPGLGANAAIDLAPGVVSDPVQLAKGAAAYVDAGEHAAVVYFPDSEAKTLRGKLSQYGDPAKVVKSGAPRNNKLVAPIEQIRRPTLVDLADPWDLESELLSGVAAIWVELWTPGGRFGAPELREAIQSAIGHFARDHSADGHVERYEAADHDIYLARLSPGGVRLLPTAVPAVTRIHEPSQARLERVAQDVVGQVIADDAIQPPPASAPTVAVLDTGIAEDHPLLERTLVAPGVSVVPGVTSAQDAFPQGHGTGMAGAAAYRALAADIARGGLVSPRCRIANVRLWSDDPAAFWASRTEEAVAEADAMPGQVAAQLLCLSSGRRPLTPRTSWSYAVDSLAYNNGEGRLICVAAGNVPPEADPAVYPATNQAAELHDPAQAVNALTVAGFTNLDALRSGRAGLVPVAKAGELSPHTTTGTLKAPIKPDVLTEAGNACPDGTLANVGIEELSVLTTSSRHVMGRYLESYDGTSIAAAALAGLASDVADANRARRPETIRALIVNSARWPAALRSQVPNRNERLRCAGYGVPRREHALASTSSRATLIHEGRMAPYSAEGKLDALHLLRLPFPHDELLALGHASVSLAVTLSYFVEPHETRSTRYAGAWLQWDLQRQSESEGDFLARVNEHDRDPDAPPDPSDNWNWEIGTQARRRGSVQGDRLEIEAAALAGDLLVGVFPAGGWWKDHLKQRAGREVPYAMVITIDAGDVDIDLYALISVRLPVDVSIDVS
ncbi:MAG: S8 family serine peptidase [Actinomycetota bacterium]|nr:S8 family serine peptidase [Actinomycetota bacterium]